MKLKDLPYRVKQPVKIFNHYVHQIQVLNFIWYFFNWHLLFVIFRWSTSIEFHWCLLYIHTNREIILFYVSSRTEWTNESTWKYDMTFDKYSFLFFFFDIDVIWRKYMAGWREVCDECTTTLFNYHYMCKQCGHMICVECSNYFSQLSTEKRKSTYSNLFDSYLFNVIYLELKRACTHDSSYSLSEFIPWESMYTFFNINWISSCFFFRFSCTEIT